MFHRASSSRGHVSSAGHPFEHRNVLRLADVEGEPYLDRINCEYATTSTIFARPGIISTLPIKAED